MSTLTLPPAPDAPTQVHFTFECRCSSVRVQTVLEQGGQFAGINRKVQLKALRWAQPPTQDGGGGAADVAKGADGKAAEAKPRCVEALLILKHGGVLTHAGRAQVSSCCLRLP